RPHECNGAQAGNHTDRAADAHPFEQITLLLKPTAARNGASKPAAPGPLIRRRGKVLDGVRVRRRLDSTVPVRDHWTQGSPFDPGDKCSARVPATLKCKCSAGHKEAATLWQSAGHLAASSAACTGRLWGYTACAWVGFLVVASSC